MFFYDRFLALTSTGPGGFMVLCLGAPEGSTDSDVLTALSLIRQTERAGDLTWDKASDISTTPGRPHVSD